MVAKKEVIALLQLQELTNFYCAINMSHELTKMILSHQDYIHSYHVTKITSID